MVGLASWKNPLFWMNYTRRSVTLGPYSLRAIFPLIRRRAKGLWLKEPFAGWKCSCSECFPAATSRLFLLYFMRGFPTAWRFPGILQHHCPAFEASTTHPCLSGCSVGRFPAGCVSRLATRPFHKSSAAGKAVVNPVRFYTRIHYRQCLLIA